MGLYAWNTYAFDKIIDLISEWHVCGIVSPNSYFNRSYVDFTNWSQALACWESLMSPEVPVDHNPIIFTHFHMIITQNITVTDDEGIMISTSTSIESSCSHVPTRKAVSFHCVDIREYDVTFHGSHPTVKKGPALSLDWTYTENESRPVNDYEIERCGLRRSSGLLKLNHSERSRKLVLDFGFSLQELQSAFRRRIPATRSRSSIAPSSVVLGGNRRRCATRWCYGRLEQTITNFDVDGGGGGMGSIMQTIKIAQSFAIVTIPIKYTRNHEHKITKECK